MREASPLRYQRQISIKPNLCYYSTYFYHLKAKLVLTKILCAPCHQDAEGREVYQSLS